MRNSQPIYVESHIDCSIDEIWAHTQEPAVHQRWDVRFTDIDYLPRSDDNAPQQFLYATKVAPGLTVSGRGETLGDRHRPDGTAYSGLRFWSDHPLSLIEEGSGYWRYVPADGGGVRFLTRYDYTVRWGAFGRLIDELLFRRLFGWGTAWSFDRLRLWIECGITPEQSLRRTIAHAVTVMALGITAALLTLQAQFVTGLIAASAAVLAIALRRCRNNLPSGRLPLRTRPPSSPAATNPLTTNQPSSNSPRKAAA